MDANDRAREAGFTLVELLTVVSVMGILVAIAVATMLGASDSASDRAAQSNLRVALTTQQAIFQETESYTTALTGVDSLTEFEPSLQYAGDLAPATSGVVYIGVNGTTLTMGSKSSTGSCLYMRDDSADTEPVKYASTDACPAPTAVADAAFGTTW